VQQDLARTKEGEQVGQAGGRDLSRQEAARRDVEKSDTRRALGRFEGGQVGRRPGHERLGVQDGARRDNPRDVASDEAPGGSRILDLVADGDLAPRGHEPRDVVLDGVVRHAAHRGLDVGVLVPRGQRDPEHRSGFPGVVEEHLVEVAHPVEQDGVRDPALHLEVLPEHRRGSGRRRAHRVC
jgi:hypothetical protein